MSKVTSKRQVSIPKEVADRYGIEPGDEIDWIPAGDEIRVVVGGSVGTQRLGVAQRLALFDRATERRDHRAAGAAQEERPDAPGGRAWTRDELYGRGRSG
ncbi:MAG: AbrB/MazE/SpoVT family DNA-binding domain-containing protein [Gemmatimonadota bacterium]